MALVVTAFLAPAAAAGIVGGGTAELLAVATLVWRRFNQEYKLTVAAAPDGLRLRSGLVALNAETIRPGRVQAVRLVEPFLWRRLGWCRLEVDLAGRQKRKGEGEATRGQLRALLPGRQPGARVRAARPARPGCAASRAAGAPPRRLEGPASLPVPRVGQDRGRGRDAHRAHPARDRLGAAREGAEHPPAEGPVQRLLGLRTVHVDTAGRALHAALRDRDRTEADGALDDLVGLARAARRAPP